MSDPGLSRYFSMIESIFSYCSEENVSSAALAVLSCTAASLLIVYLCFAKIISNDLDVFFQQVSDRCEHCRLGDRDPVEIGFDLPCVEPEGAVPFPFFIY